MASSDKPDFIDIDQKGAPLKLTEGGLSGCGEPAQEANSASAGVAAVNASLVDAGRSDAVSTNAVRKQSDAMPPAAQSSSRRSVQPGLNDDTAALFKKNIPPGKAMRRLPGGPVTFISLLAVVCLFGNQIDEMRNRTLADLARGFAIQEKGYVETVGDLGSSLRRHGNLPEAQRAYEKALRDLLVNHQDSGAKGAFIRLKMAEIAFQNANRQSRIADDDSTPKYKADMASASSRKYKKQADDLAKKALELLKADHTSVPAEMPFLLFSVGDSYEDWYEYETAIKLNEQALELWGSGSPNRRSNVNAALGFQYIMLKDWQKAEDRLRQSVTWSMRDGATAYNAWRLSILGRAQIGLKKYAEAETNLTNALKMNQDLKRNRDSNLDLARIYTDLGRVKAAHGSNAQARTFFENSAKLLKKYPSRTWDTMRNQLEMANLYRDMGQTTKADSLYSDIVSKLDQNEYGPDRKEVLREWNLSRALRGDR